jgi:hypothetical protein
MLRSTPNAHLAEQDGYLAHATIDAQKAPQIANTPFALTCELTTAQRDAILIAHGGASTGYALHLSGGKLMWAIRHGKTLTTARQKGPAHPPTQSKRPHHRHQPRPHPHAAQRRLLPRT